MLALLDDRLRFLEHFLGALGARRIDWTSVQSDCVQGTVVYDLDDPSETQDFAWLMAESAAPSRALMDLVAVIRAQSLLCQDKLTISAEELRRRYSAHLGRVVGIGEFSQLFAELLKVQVPMLDEGKESDAYFIHQ